VLRAFKVRLPSHSFMERSLAPAANSYPQLCIGRAKALAMMVPENPFIAHILDQLGAFGPVVARAMFGGYGLYLHGVMFALVTEDTLYFKTDARNRDVFEAAGTGPFVYEIRGRKVAMSYHEAPPDALEDPDALVELARGAYAAAQRAKAAAPRRLRARRLS
jgi:DNA transformation protein and related proteins